MKITLNLRTLKYIGGLIGIIGLSSGIFSIVLGTASIITYGFVLPVNTITVLINFEKIGIGDDE